jgi:hypothetical protein
VNIRNSIVVKDVFDKFWKFGSKLIQSITYYALDFVENDQRQRKISQDPLILNEGLYLQIMSSLSNAIP